LITFSDLYEAVVQQPTPPQQPVQPTGAQIPQQPMQQPQMQPGQPPIQQDGQQPQPEQQPTGVFGKIKAGYDKLNAKYEAGKSVAKDLGGVAAGLAVPIGLYGASFVSNPALAGALRTTGMAAMVARPLLGAMRQTHAIVNQPRYPQQ